MRVERTRTIAASRELIWERVRDPAGYPGLREGVTRCDVKSEGELGLGSRYSMRMRVRSADVGGVVELVEFDEPGDLSWTNLTGIDQRSGSRTSPRAAYS